MKSKIISVIIVISILLPSSISHAMGYEDIQIDAGTTLYKLGLIKGDSTGVMNLRESDSLTRAESIILVLRMLRLEDKAANFDGMNFFSDVDSSKWYAPYINYAKDHGITNGKGNGLFGPNDNVTIKELLTMFLRATGYTADWSTEDIWQKSVDYGLTLDLHSFITDQNQASRGDTFIIYYNAMELPFNPRNHYLNTCVLSELMKENPSLQTLVSEYSFLKDYLPGNYVADYTFLGDDAPTVDPANPTPSNNGEFVLVKAAPSSSINVIDLIFNKQVDINTSKHHVKVTNVTGDFGEYTKSWFLDESNYTVQMFDKKVMVKYQDGASSVDLNGLTFTIDYDVKQRDAEAKTSGTETVAFGGSGNNPANSGSLKFVKIEAGAKNVINLFFNELLDNNTIHDAVTITNVQGDFGEYNKSWFLDKEHYIVGTTDKKVYVRYMDGAASVDIRGLTFDLEYDVKARNSNDRASGSETINIGNSGQNTPNTLKFESIEFSNDANNVINLFFNEKLDTGTNRDNIEILDVQTKGISDKDEDFFKNPDNYVVSTTHHKVYIRFMENGQHSVPVKGMYFKIRYNIDARDSDDNVTDTVELESKKIM